MKEVYDLHQHTTCVIIYIAKTEVHTNVIRTSNRNSSIDSLDAIVTQEACITYNEQRTQILNCGDAEFDQENQDHIRIDDFMGRLYAIFEKKKDTRDMEDQLLMQAISDYLQYLLVLITEDPNLRIETPDALHFVFIVPSEWPEEIRLELVRPIFVKANIISDSDHQDRLLFLTDVESFCYGLRSRKTDVVSFERGQNTVLSRITAIETNNVMVKLNLIQTMNDLFDFDGATLFPKVMRSNSFAITSEYIKNSIRDFLKDRLDPMPHDLAMEAMVEGLFNSKLPALGSYGSEGDLKTPWFTSKIKWRINKSQKEFIKSLNPFDICSAFDSTFIDNFRFLISSNVTKEYIVLFVEEHFYSSCVAEPALIDWIKCILDYSRRFLNSISRIDRADLINWQISQADVLQGAGFYVVEVIQNSDLYSKPRILPMKDNTTSSSIFLNSKPNAIVNIDISLESTLLSCSVLTEDGLVKEILDHSYFTAEKCLPALGSFYQFSDAITLNVKEQFIFFSEEYFFNDFDELLVDKDVIESILNNFIREKMISTRQQPYIKAFFKMYMVYIKQIVTSRLCFNTKIKIGYAVSIEKKILHDIVGTEQEFEELLFATKLVCKNDDFSKLRIITRGDGLLPVIKKYFGLEFAVRSYFVLSQVHQDYIQLTLNQVVTKDEKEPEHVVFKNQIIPITNIYKTLCLYLWEDIKKDSSLLHLCDIHNESDRKTLELFSLESQINFTRSLTHYISNNILSENADWKNLNKSTILLSRSCKCKVCFTSKDIIEISFMPLLENIVSVVSSSLSNPEFFGKYRTIDYVFTMVYFNYNTQFQDILVRALNEKFEDYNRVRGINANCLLIPELPSKFLQPILLQRPLSYTPFLNGALRQVHGESYGFSLLLKEDDETFFYKKKKSDQAMEASDKNLFTLVLKGNRMSDGETKDVFYVNLKSELDAESINILYREIKTSGTSETPSDDFDKDLAGYSEIYTKTNQFSQGSDIPLLVSTIFKGYSSSLQFSIRIVGENNPDDFYSNIGEPLTLYRF